MGSEMCIRDRDGAMYTIEDIRPVPAQWNTSERKQERRHFADWLMNEGVNHHKVFVDEFGVNVWTARSKGRSPRGTRAVYIVEGQRGKNITICLAISPLIGLVHWRVIVGGMTQNLFSDFLMELAELLCVHEEPFFVLCDNACAHHDAPNMGDQGEVVYLPKYAPYLNACEMAGSCLKAAIKRNLTEPETPKELYNRNLKI